MIDRRQFLGSIAALGLGSINSLDAIALQAGEPSRTALSAALQRAAHQLLERPLVFNDPLALRILGSERVKWLAMNLARYRTQRSQAMRAFLIARSRYAEDELEHLYQRGVRQYIVLGAGLDTFACRNAHGKSLRVFEVDHPSTQAWKRTQLREHGIEIPPSLRFVPVDFERRLLADGLREARFRQKESVFISWLGVTMYLTRDAVLQTLNFFAKSCARGSEIVFDFSLPDEALSEIERASRARRAQRVARIGEPWISRFNSSDLAGELRAMGYSVATHFGSEEVNERYFSNRADEFRVRGSGRIMTARI